MLSDHSSKVSLQREGVQGFPSAAAHLADFCLARGQPQSQHMTLAETQVHTVLSLCVFMTPPTYSSITCIPEIRLETAKHSLFSRVEFQAVTFVACSFLLVQTMRGGGCSWPTGRPDSSPTSWEVTKSGPPGGHPLRRTWVRDLGALITRLGI